MIRNRIFVIAIALLISQFASARSTQVTFYHPTGHRSACGATKGPWSQIAVSRDLLKSYPCGTVVRVTLTPAKGGIRSFKAVVWDKIDILVGKREPALKWGLSKAAIQRLR